MSIKCKIDNSEHSGLPALLYHLKKIRVSKEKYFTEYETRFCRQTKEKIPYKTLEQYLSTDFINKNEMKKWYKENPELAKTYTIELIKKRIQEKGIKKALCETELKSLGLPRIKYFLQNFDYKKLNKELGLNQYFNYSLVPEFHKKDVKVYVDSREQKALSFARQEVVALNYGDYSSDSNKKLVIERKNASDQISSFGAKDNLARLEREIQRAVEDGGYIVVLCEEDINTMLSFDYLPHLKRYTKVTPAILFHNIRYLIQKYDNIQFAFCKGRERMKEVMDKLFHLKTDVSRLDLQHLIAEKLI